MGLVVVLIWVSFPHGFLEHPSRPASRLTGARARLLREAAGRSLAAGGRRCGKASYSGFMLLDFSLATCVLTAADPRSGTRAPRGVTTPAPVRAARHSSRS